MGKNIIYKINLKSFVTAIAQIIALITSWFLNRSIGWAIFHGLFGPIYLIYLLLTGELNGGVLRRVFEFYF